MKLKKIATLALTAILTGMLFTGCGEENKTENALQVNEKKLGMISKMNVSETNYNSFLQKYEVRAGIKLSHQVIFYDDLNSLQMGLQSKSIDEMSVYNSVGKYIISKNSQMEILNDHMSDFTDSFCFALRKEDSELKNSFDGAIKSMKDDGTLDNLVKTYITDLKEDPPTVDIENISGADTIKVGITGDLPPLDLILSDGTAAGFNTAVLSEISKRIGKNIELVQIESGARAAALTSKKIDVIFWAIIPSNEIFPSDIDKPESVEMTSAYYRDNVVHIELKK